MKKLSIELLADTVLNKRKEKNISQQELANQTGNNKTMSSHLESKDYMTSISQLKALANTLDFDITSLFIDDKNIEKEPLHKSVNITVAGTGYVGLSIAVLLAQHNHVTAVDIIEDKVNKINNKISPIQDNEIEEYLVIILFMLTICSNRIGFILIFAYNGTKKDWSMILSSK